MHNRLCGIICAGGAIIALSSNLRFTGNTTFIDNSAAISESCTQVYGEKDIVGGGAIYASDNTVLSFNGTSNFINNSPEIYGSGGAIFTFNNTVLSFNGTSNFINNSAEVGGGGGAIYAFNNIVLSFNGTSNFINNFAENGGAISASTNSALIFNGAIYIINNGHYRGGVDMQDGNYSAGGGVFMGLNSTFFILPNATVYWENNHATLGGAIYVIDASPLSYCTSVVPKEECFFSTPWPESV